MDQRNERFVPHVLAVMVGTIVERVSGQRYDAYVGQHVLDPLGLRAGYLPDALDAGRFAQIYSWNEARQDYVRSEAAYAPLGKRLDGYRMGYGTAIATVLFLIMLVYITLVLWRIYQQEKELA